MYYGRKYILLMYTIHIISIRMTIYTVFHIVHIYGHMQEHTSDVCIIYITFLYVYDHVYNFVYKHI